METILAYLLAFVVQLPFLLLEGAPFLLVAALVWFGLRRKATPSARYLIASAIASIGVAPVLGAHGSMMTAVLLLAFGPVTAAVAIVSMLVFWFALLAVGFAFGWVRVSKNGTSDSAHSESITTTKVD